MTSELAQAGNRRVGIKQTLKAIKDGKATLVFLAQDADTALLEAILQECKARNIPTQSVPTMRELGRACGIQVPSATAALIQG